MTREKTSGSDEPRPPRAGEELDPRHLMGWLVEAGLVAADRATDLSALEILQYPAGHSNLSYRIRHEAPAPGAPPLRAVLRRPPVGAAVKSGHDMGREFRLISALHGTFPVPRPLAFEATGQVLGVPFYAMEEVAGLIVRKRLEPSRLTSPLAPTEAHRRLSELMIDTMVALHALDPTALGLSDLYRGAGFAKRQVEGWSRRWESALTEDVPAMERLRQQLLGRAPEDAGAVLVHNDLKYDNCVLTPDLGQVVAVLDWEMATVGCPLMDLGTSLGYWVEDGDPPFMKILAMGPTWAEGSLDREGVLARYQAASGRQISDPVFYFAFGLFKIAVVAQQIYRRWVEGRTRDPRFASLGHAVAGLADLAVRAFERDRISRLGA